MTRPTGQRPLRLAVDGRVLDDRYHGIGRTTEALLRHMAGRPDVEVTLFVSKGQQSKRFDVDGLVTGSGFVRESFDLPLTSPLQYLRWPSALRRAGVDAVLFPYHVGASIAGPRSVARWSIVHDCIFEADPRFAPDTRTRLLYKAMTRLVVKRTSVLSVSRASADEIGRYYHVDVPDPRIVSWGVDGAFSRPAEPAVEVNGTKLPETYYLNVGARRPHKNAETLVRALATMPDDEALVLVGSADARWPDQVDRIAAELGVQDRVVQLSGVSEADLLRLYAGARAFLYPSLVEGFGLPLIEAMAAGVPVVASDIPVFREVSAGAAVLVPATQPEAWSRAVRELDDDERRRSLVEAGLLRAHAATWDSAVDTLLTALSG